MNISVIIPVYNAEKYVRHAVESALNQDETREVVLAEDRSTDNSFSVCRELAAKHDRVVLYRHPDEGNHGAAETRNLGIRKATYDYIAFLDADDFYLPGRFKTARSLFAEKKEIDGVYEAVGVHCEDASAKKIWAAHSDGVLTILSKKVDPEDLFDFMLTENASTFHLNGLVVRKSLFQRCGYFFKNLRLHQDTAMNFQMALFGNLHPGRLTEPVAMRRVHAGSRFFSSYNKDNTQYQMWQTLFRWAKKKKLSRDKLSKLFVRYQYKACRLGFPKYRGRSKNYYYLGVLLMESFKNVHLAGSSIKFFSKKILIKLGKFL